MYLWAWLQFLPTVCRSVFAREQADPLFPDMSTSPTHPMMRCNLYRPSCLACVPSLSPRAAHISLHPNQHTSLGLLSDCEAPALGSACKDVSDMSQGQLFVQYKICKDYSSFFYPSFVFCSLFCCLLVRIIIFMNGVMLFLITELCFLSPDLMEAN